MNLADAQQAIIEYIRAYNAFDIAGMIKNLHKDVVFENFSNNQVNLTTRGIEEFKKQAEYAKTVFAQREQKVISWDFKDNVVTVKVDYNGVLATDISDQMRAGDTLHVEGISIFKFQDGKIISIQDKS